MNRETAGPPLFEPINGAVQNLALLPPCLVEQGLDLRKLTNPHTKQQCNWCGNPNQLGSIFVSGFGGSHCGEQGGAYCSQRCYEGFRRAVFKKRSACLWCRNSGVLVTTICSLENIFPPLSSYETKFCSEYCLNQFKLKLFCEETTSHFPQISIDKNRIVTGDESTQDLITPALWLSNKTYSDQPTLFQKNLAVNHAVSNGIIAQNNPGQLATKFVKIDKSKNSEPARLKMKANGRSIQSTGMPVTKGNPGLNGYGQVVGHMRKPQFKRAQQRSIYFPPSYKTDVGRSTSTISLSSGSNCLPMPTNTCENDKGMHGNTTQKAEPSEKLPNQRQPTVIPVAIPFPILVPIVFQPMLTTLTGPQFTMDPIEDLE